MELLSVLSPTLYIVLDPPLYLKNLAVVLEALHQRNPACI